MFHIIGKICVIIYLHTERRVIQRKHQIYNSVDNLSVFFYFFYCSCALFCFFFSLVLTHFQFGAEEVDQITCCSTFGMKRSTEISSFTILINRNEALTKDETHIHQALKPLSEKEKLMLHRVAGGSH